MHSLSMLGITKRFGTLVALDRVDLHLRAGEVNALIGENGAGKTTLMRILYGLERADSGIIECDGKKIDIPNPQTAVRLGIGMVQQRLRQFPNMSLLENIVLGAEPSRWGLLDANLARSRLANYCHLLKLEADWSTPLGELPLSTRQKVEILRLLYREAQVLIFDEPTSVLTPQETEELFGIISRLKTEGKTIVYISHKIWEVLRISDWVTVLRKGTLQCTLPTREATAESLTRAMIGEDLQPLRQEGSSIRSKVALEVRNLSVRSAWRELKSITFIVSQGEIVGVAGIEDSGQQELVQAILGLLTPSQGEIVLDNILLNPLSVSQRRACGLAFIPEDRDREGACLDFSIAENLIATRLHNPPVKRGLFIDWGAVRRLAKDQMRRYSIRAPSVWTSVSQMSGGNVQKVIIARELYRTPKLLLAVHPTRGLDVGATRSVHEQLLALARDGCGVLLISSELEELFALCNRILVMREGHLVGDLKATHATPKIIGSLMLGLEATNG
jgi:simple sugar transport system ATP-binding protein